MAKHAAPKPSPYSIAAGAVAYAVALTFHKNIPPEIVASGPVAVALAVNAVERSVEVVDPKAAVKVDRLGAQAEQAAKDLAADVSAGIADAPKVDAEVKPLVG